MNIAMTLTVTRQLGVKTSTKKVVNINGHYSMDTVSIRLVCITHEKNVGFSMLLKSKI